VIIIKKKELFDQFWKEIGVKFSWERIDDLIMSDANIFRPIKGHAFEIKFDNIIKDNFKKDYENVQIIEEGGDSDIDRILIDKNNNKHTLQLKTCTVNLTKPDESLGVSLHKTHGREKNPNNLYPFEWPCPHCNHFGDEFPEFLVIQHPKKGVLIVPKNEIPEHKSYPGHFADPAIFNWYSKWLNRWDLLGFPEYKNISLDHRNIEKQDKLPQVSNAVHLTDEQIIKMLLKPENFRVLQMNLKGNLREPAMEKWLIEKGINIKEPDHSYPKYDRISVKSNVRIQIKGPSKNLTDIHRDLIGVEVMGSHRKGSGRRYSETDFDYLGFVIDPVYIDKKFNLSQQKYHFCFIPTKSLPLHYKNNFEWDTKDKIYEGCKFIIDENEKGAFLKPATNYRRPSKYKGQVREKVKFRDDGPWYIDVVPEEIF
jgi:hypothetical protein